MEKHQKILVQIDGGNVYHRIKSLIPRIHLSTYDYFGLAQLLTKQQNPTLIYYVGSVRTERGNSKSVKLRAGQQRLFDHLRASHIRIKLGYLLKINNVYHEKGVDVQIAVDIVRGALKDEYDKCYLLSSDSDLLPAIQLAQQEDKQVIYVAFDKPHSQILNKNCSSTLILSKKQIQQFIQVPSS